MFTPNTTVEIYPHTGEETLDEWGDPVNNDTPSATDVPAFIWEDSRSFMPPGGLAPITVTEPRALLPHGTVVDDGDLVVDAMGRYFRVLYVFSDSNPYVAMPVRVKLTKTT